jgi:hypothetical protein
MHRVRIVLAAFVAVALAFAPVTGFATAKPCHEASQSMTGGGMEDCPCQTSLPGCAGIAQCQTMLGRVWSYLDCGIMDVRSCRAEPRA